MVGLYGFNRGWRHEWIGSRDAATGMGSITERLEFLERRPVLEFRRLVEHGAAEIQLLAPKRMRHRKPPRVNRRRLLQLCLSRRRIRMRPERASKVRNLGYCRICSMEHVC